jgi:hypothetical protein
MELEYEVSVASQDEAALVISLEEDPEAGTKLKYAISSKIAARAPELAALYVVEAVTGVGAAVENVISGGGSSSGGSSSSVPDDSGATSSGSGSGGSSSDLVSTPATTTTTTTTYAIKSEKFPHCNQVLNADVYTEDGNDDLETNFDEVKFGHAKYECLETMLLDHGQYEKAMSYAWCVLPHCGEQCAGPADTPKMECPTYSWNIFYADECESAVYNFLGFAHRKYALELVMGKQSKSHKAHDAWSKLDKDRKFAEEPEAELALAKKYYEKALDLWTENCGALAYESELYLQKGELQTSWYKLQDLCDNQWCRESHQAAETIGVFQSAGARLPASCLDLVPKNVASSGEGFGGDAALESGAHSSLHGSSQFFIAVVSSVFGLLLLG